MVEIIDVTAREDSAMEEKISGYTKLLSLYEKEYGKLDQRCMDLRFVIAGVYFRHQKYERSLREYNAIEQLYKGDDDEKELAKVRDLRAITLLKVGDAEASLKTFASVVRFYEEVGCPEEVVVELKLKYANSLENSGFFYESNTVLNEVYNDYADEYGENDTKTLHVKLKMAELTLKEGKAEDSLKLVEALEQVFLSEFGQSNDHYATLKNVLGNVYVATGDYDLALESYKLVKSTCRRVHGVKSEQAMHAASKIGSIHLKLEDYELANEEYTEVYEVNLGQYGKESARTLEARRILGYIEMKLDELKQSYKTFKSVHKSCENIFDRSNIEVYESKAALAAVLVKERNFDQAIEKFEEVRAGYLKTYGQNHVRTSSVEHILNDLKRLDERFTKSDRENIAEIAIENSVTESISTQRQQDTFEDEEESTWNVTSGKLPSQPNDIYCTDDKEAETFHDVSDIEDSRISDIEPDDEAQDEESILASQIVNKSLENIRLELEKENEAKDKSDSEEATWTEDTKEKAAWTNTEENSQTLEKSAAEATSEQISENLMDNLESEQKISTNETPVENKSEAVPDHIEETVQIEEANTEMQVVKKPQKKMKRKCCTIS